MDFVNFPTLTNGDISWIGGVRPQSYSSVASLDGMRHYCQLKKVVIAAVNFLDFLLSDQHRGSVRNGRQKIVHDAMQILE